MKTASKQTFVIVDEVSATGSLTKPDTSTQRILVKDFFKTFFRKETKAQIRDSEEKPEDVVHPSQCMKINRNRRYQ